MRKLSKAGGRTILKRLEKIVSDRPTAGEHCLAPKATEKNLLLIGASVRVLSSVFLSSAENGPWNK